MLNNEFSKPISIKDFGVSFAIHSLIILIIIISSYRNENRELENSTVKPKLTKAQKLINSAVRVDIVAMPRLTVKEMKKLRPPSRLIVKKVAKAPKKTAPAPVVKKTAPIAEQSKNSFRNLLKNLSKKEINLKNVKKKQAVKLKKKTEEISPEVQKQLAALKNLALEGNKISKGSQVLSDKISLKEQKVNLEQYAQDIIVAVKPNWKLPSYLLKKKINCQVRVYISENGDLLNVEIYKSSGDQEFDGRAIKAVEDSAPFDIPDKSIRSRLVAGEILLGFPL